MSESAQLAETCERINHLTPTEELPALMTIPEVMAYLRVGRSAAYLLAKSKGKRFGSLIRITREAVTQ